MILLVKLLRESILFAFGSIVANKLRTILTLLGITIGIFAIISVFSVVDSLERQIRSSIASLGDNVIYVQKWPWSFDMDFQWWDYASRPVPELGELPQIQRRAATVEAAVFMASTRRRVEYMNSSVNNVTIIGASSGYEEVRNFEINDGRFFNELDAQQGRNVAVMGFDLAEDLFPNIDPIGRTIKVFGHNTVVVGVFEKEGIGGFDDSHDNTLVIPVGYMNQFIDVNQERFGPMIMTKAKSGISNEEMKDELTGIMRAIRRLPPAADNNFSLNEASLLSEGFDEVFRIIKMAGWLIGGFSILVGGFGIANIMFVSVRERTSIIGIQKALGAKNYFILWQFLFEAVLLSIIGGSVGIILVFTGTAIITSIFEFNFLLSFSNIVLGLNVSAIIGLVSGFIPAWAAARLDPVEAIRSTG